MPDMDIQSEQRVRDLVADFLADVYTAEEREAIGQFVVNVLGDAGLAVAGANPVRTSDGTPVSGKLYGGNGRFFHVGAPAKSLLGFILAAFAGHPVKGIASLSNLIRFDRRLMPRLITLYKQVDGLERDVLDALHREFAQWVVVNYDYARDPHRQDKAYGHLWPMAEDVAKAIGRDLADVEATLTQLLQDGIVSVEDGRWAIVF